IAKKFNVDYELRTTLVPGLVGERELKMIHKQIFPYKIWVWQMFRSDIGNIVDKGLVGKSFSVDEMVRIRNLSKKMKNVILRF
ncbi:MAG: hypothetical protein QXP04_00880, partial [Candidatus Nanoarchaeia archaeon]|nr:hypothetical protein [Candidatus Jingweiarchaeum tengchongense]